MASHDWWPHVRRLEVPALLRAIAWFARVARGTINHLGGRGHPSWDAAGRGGLATEPEPGARGSHHAPGEDLASGRPDPAHWRSCLRL
jgi:hypothetical protein